MAKISEKGPAVAMLLSVGRYTVRRRGSLSLRRCQDVSQFAPVPVPALLLRNRIGRSRASVIRRIVIVLPVLNYVRTCVPESTFKFILFRDAIG